MRVSTKYDSHPISGGSRIRVRWQGHNRLMPYDLSARDAHVAAIKKAIPEATEIVMAQRQGTRPERGYVWDVTTPTS